ncbi:MAG: hypothetical protein H6918_03890 [Sphingomonadaceae bacterium]|nr:hypothetical protein [Sphingomonadaceae bacterium]
MSIFDSILKQVSGAPDDVTNLASKLGIDPGMAEKAIAALGQAHQMEGDTVELAAAKTGLDTGTISQILEQVGGEGSLTQFANAIKNDPASLSKLFDRDGDGSAMDDVMDMAKGLFGKK